MFALFLTIASFFKTAPRLSFRLKDLDKEAAIQLDEEMFALYLEISTL